MDERVDQFSVSQAISAPRLGQQVGCARHAFHPASNDERRFTGADERGSQRHRLETAAAHLVDRQRADRFRETAAQRRLTGRRLPKPGADHIPHNALIDLRRVNRCARNGFPNDVCTQVGGGDGAKHTLEFPDRCARRADDHNVVCVRHHAPPSYAARIDVAVVYHSQCVADEYGVWYTPAAYASVSERRGRR
jgi:hypothetical protein